MASGSHPVTPPNLLWVLIESAPILKPKKQGEMNLVLVVMDERGGTRRGPSQELLCLQSSSENSPRSVASPLAKNA